MDIHTLMELVVKAQAGDGAALENLCSVSVERITYLAQKTLQDPDVVQEVTRKTLQVIREQIGTLKQPGAYYRWLNMIAERECNQAVGMLGANPHLPDVVSAQTEMPVPQTGAPSASMSVQSGTVQAHVGAGGPPPPMRIQSGSVQASMAAAPPPLKIQSGMAPAHGGAGAPLSPMHIGGKEIDQTGQSVGNSETHGVGRHSGFDGHGSYNSHGSYDEHGGRGGHKHRRPPVRRPVGLMASCIFLVCLVAFLSVYAFQVNAFAAVWGQNAVTSSSGKGGDGGVILSNRDFPSGDFIRLDQAADMYLSEWEDQTSELLLLVAEQGGDAHKIEKVAWIDTGFTLEEKGLAAAVVETEGGVITLFAQSVDEILVEASEEWLETYPELAPPDGIYRRIVKGGGSAPASIPTPTPTPSDAEGPPESTPSPTPGTTPTPAPTPTPGPPVNPDEPIIIAASGMYEVVDAGIEDEEKFMEYYTNSYRSKKPDVTDSEITIMTDALRVLLTDHMMGYVGYAELDFRANAFALPDMLQLSSEALGRKISIGGFYEAYLPDQTSVNSLVESQEWMVGYEFGEGGYRWTNAEAPEGFPLSLEQETYMDEEKGTLHISGVMTVIDDPENEIFVESIEMEMDIYRYGDGSVEVDAYCTDHMSGGEYMTFHYMLGVEFGRINEEPVGPMPKAYVTFVDKEHFFGDQLTAKFDVLVELQDDGSYRTVMERSGLPEGYLSPTFDSAVDQLQTFAKKNKEKENQLQKMKGSTP